jgi:hypothetical protein
VNPYLARLRLGEPTKLTKPGSVSFVSDRGMRLPENRCVEEADSESVAGSENAYQRNGQNRQNLPTYDRALAVLSEQRPDLIDIARWRQAVEDGQLFLAKWGEQAEALGWTSRDLFGLHKPPDQPHPSYRRLSRYDEAGLIWLLQGRPVVALTGASAAIENSIGAITIYRRFDKPAFGPVGDSLDDFQ